MLAIDAPAIIPPLAFSPNSHHHHPADRDLADHYSLAIHKPRLQLSRPKPSLPPISAPLNHARAYPPPHPEPSPPSRSASPSPMDVQYAAQNPPFSPFIPIHHHNSAFLSPSPSPMSHKSFALDQMQGSSLYSPSAFTFDPFASDEDPGDTSSSSEEYSVMHPPTPPSAPQPSLVGHHPVTVTDTSITPKGAAAQDPSHMYNQYVARQQKIDFLRQREWMRRVTAWVDNVNSGTPPQHSHSQRPRGVYTYTNTNASSRPCPCPSNTTAWEFTPRNSTTIREFAPRNGIRERESTPRNSNTPPRHRQQQQQQQQQRRVAVAVTPSQAQPQLQPQTRTRVASVPRFAPLHAHQQQQQQQQPSFYHDRPNNTQIYYSTPNPTAAVVSAAAYHHPHPRPHSQAQSPGVEMVHDGEKEEPYLIYSTDGSADLPLPLPSPEEEEEEEERKSESVERKSSADSLSSRSSLTSSASSSVERNVYTHHHQHHRHSRQSGVPIPSSGVTFPPSPSSTSSQSSRTRAFNDVGLSQTQTLKSSLQAALGTVGARGPVSQALATSSSSSSSATSSSPSSAVGVVVVERRTHSRVPSLDSIKEEEEREES